MTGTGSILIAQERIRQIVQEGYTAEHDRAQDLITLAVAAWCYLSDYVDRSGECPTNPPDGWPWDGIDWKPTPEDPVRQLVKVGALIAAEIDGLLARNAASHSEEQADA